MAASISEKLRGLFRRGRECNKLIEYRGNNFRISTAVAAGGVHVDIKELSKQVQVLTQATNHAKVLDDYQYLLCTELKTRVKTDPDRPLLANYRIIMLGYITQVGSVLEQIKADRSNKALKKELFRLNGRMRSLIDKMRTDLLSKKRIARSSTLEFGYWGRMAAYPTHEQGVEVKRLLDQPTRTSLVRNLLAHSTFLGLSRITLSATSGAAGVTTGIIIYGYAFPQLQSGTGIHLYFINASRPLTLRGATAVSMYNQLGRIDLHPGDAASVDSDSNFQAYFDVPDLENDTYNVCVTYTPAGGTLTLTPPVTFRIVTNWNSHD